jgi:excinuclease UvrABC nuclease subunit
MTHSELNKDSRRLYQEGWLTPNSYCEDFAPLPEGPGVYLFLNCDISCETGTITEKVLYVGMSTNVSNRCSSHEIMDMINMKYDYVRTYFKSVPVENLRALEKETIQRFNPPFNIVHRKRGE